MKLRKQSGFVTPPELAEASKIDTLFVDGQSAEKDALEGTDALLHSDILGISANMLSKGHTKRILGLLSSVSIMKKDTDSMENSAAISISGDNPLSVKYGRPYVEYGVLTSGVYTGESVSISVSPNPLPIADTMDGTAVQYSIAGISAYRGVNWLAAAPAILMVGGDVSITTAESFTDEGVTIIPGNEDLTVVVVSDVDDNVAGNYTVTYNATSVLDVIVDSLVRNVTVT